MSMGTDTPTGRKWPSTVIHLMNKFQNEAPIFVNQTLQLLETTKIIRLFRTFSDANKDDLVINITKNFDNNNNGNSAFFIRNQNLVVNDPSEIDYEEITEYDLIISISDGIEVVTAEVKIELIDDRSEDVDGDGLTEELEEDVFGSSDFNVNTDGDRYSDFEEAKAGSDLTDPNSFPNEAPVISNQVYSMSESLEAGATIGVINATDPNNDLLEFLVFPNNADSDGDGNLAFRTTGNLLIVNDPDDFDYETSPQIAVLIAATDGDLSDVSLVFVN